MDPEGSQNNTAAHCVSSFFGALFRGIKISKNKKTEEENYHMKENSAIPSATVNNTIASQGQKEIKVRWDLKEAMKSHTQLLYS